MHTREIVGISEKFQHSIEIIESEEDNKFKTIDKWQTFGVAVAKKKTPVIWSMILHKILNRHTHIIL